MASIQKRGKNSFLLVVEAGYKPNGKRDKRTRTIKIEDEALLRTTKKLSEYLNAELVKFRLEVEVGEHVAPKKMAFHTFAESEWEPNFAAGKYSPTTLKKYKGQLKQHILPAIGHKPLSEIKTLQLVTFLNKLKEDGSRKDGRPGKLSSHTILDIYKILCSVFSKAVAWGAVSKNPMEGVEPPAIEEVEQDFYDSNEAQEVIKALFQEPLGWRMYFLGAMLGGFRRGELTALEWPEVNFETGTFEIKQALALTEHGEARIKAPKTKKSKRTVDMPEWYMRELKEYYKEWIQEKWQLADAWEGEDKQYVFHGGTGKPYYFTTPTQKWARFLKKHNLRHVKLHSLRHTMGTLIVEVAIEEGIDEEGIMKALQKRFGHSNREMTNMYTHITKKVSKTLAKKLDKFDPRKTVNNSSTNR